jgi:hypothetical protein
VLDRGMKQRTTELDSHSHPRLARAAKLTLALAIIALAALLLYPIASLRIHLAEIACVLAMLLSAAIILRRRAPVLLILALPFVALALPARRPDVPALRARFVARLKAHEGERYVWGGESPLGIDCSGLMRCALREAALREGLRRIDPGMLRLAVATWWRDESARAMGEGDRTIVMREADSIASLARDACQPGDLAVTRDGVHVLAFLGDAQWAQANPMVDRVVIEDQSAPDPWLSRPVTLVRWRALNE